MTSTPCQEAAKRPPPSFRAVAVLPRGAAQRFLELVLERQFDVVPTRLTPRIDSQGLANKEVIR